MKTIEVTKLAPTERHGTIIQAFLDLKNGEAFEIEVDHDPKPLFYQFQFEYAGKFVWEYLEDGPSLWKVRIGKTEGNSTA